MSTRSLHTATHPKPPRNAPLPCSKAPRTVGIPSSTRCTDPYYGQEDVALVCHDYLVNVYSCSPEPEGKYARRQPPLTMFVAQLIQITNMPYSVTSAALILLQRLRATLPHDLEGFSGHRLFLAAYIVSAQEHCLPGSAVFNPLYWSKLSFFSLDDIEDMQSQLVERLEGNVNVFPSYASLMEQMQSPFGIKSYLDITSRPAHERRSNASSASSSYSSLEAIAILHVDSETSSTDSVRRRSTSFFKK